MASALVARLLSLAPPPSSGFWAVLGLLLAYFGLWASAYVQEKSYLSLSRQPPPQHAGDSSSLWGGRTQAIEHPERALFDNDSYYWIRYAQEMVLWKTPRIRYTLLDNVPYGREVHWSSGYSWLIVLAGLIEAVGTGQSVIQAIPDAAVWVNTALFAIVLAALAWALTKRASGLAAGLVVFTLSCLPGITWAFAYGRPGHHGIHSLAALGGLCCLILGGLGWVRRPEAAGADSSFLSPLARSEARRWFIAAGVFAGIGLWVGATLQVVVIGSLGLGVLLVGRVAARENASATHWDGSLWLVWGITSAISSLAFFLIEYFPSHLFSMRLEVNHPLYAIALLAGSAFLSRAPDFWSAQGWRRSWPWFLGCGLVVALAPAAVLLGPREWHSLRDPYMRRLHDSIMNFQPLLALPGDPWPKRLFHEFGLIPLALPLFAWIGLRGKADLRLRSAVVFLIPPALILAAWTFYQVRWSNLFTPVMAMVILVTLWWCFGATSRRQLAFRLALPAVMVVPTWIWWLTTLRDIPRARAAQTPDGMLARAMATRDIALNLQRYAKLREVRVMSAPTETPALHYFGGVAGTGSLYWENIPGVHDAADFFADFGEDDARRIAKKRGINFVVVQEDPGGAFDACWVKLASKNESDVKQTLAYRLSAPGRHDIPKWLEPVPIYSSPAAELFRMRLYRVVWDN